MPKPISIYRAPRSDNPYFMMARATAQDEKLSYEALGMLTYLLSKPDNWQIRVTDLEKRDAGREKVRRILNELQAAHYLKKRPRQNAKGQMQGWDWECHETPVLDTISPENRTTGKPSDGKPVPLDNTENTQSTESIHIADGEKTPPPDPSKEDPPKDMKAIQKALIPEVIPDPKPAEKKPPTLFDVIALEVFGLEHINGDGAKVGKFLKNLLHELLLKQTPEAKAVLLRDMIEMYKWWAQTKFDNAGNSLGKPAHIETICRALREYRESPRFKDLRAVEMMLNGH